MKFKRFLSLTLSVLLVLGAVPAASLFVGAASATYDIAAAFDSTDVTVNGDTQSAADVFELKTMTADGIADYTYDDGKTIADFISDGGLSVPYSVAANSTTGTAAAVNFVKLKDDVAEGRTLNSYYVDFDATNAQLNRTSLGQGFGFAYDSSTGSYDIVQYAKARTDLPMQANLYTVAKTAYTGNKNGWLSVGAADALTDGITYYYRVNFAYTYSSDKVSKVTVTTSVYGTDADRTADTNAVATNSADLGIGSYSNYLTADMTPCFAFASGNDSEKTNVIKSVVINYSKTAEEIAADEAAENKAAADKFVEDYAGLLSQDVTEVNAQQFVDAYTAFAALTDGAKTLLENYNGTDYAALVKTKYDTAVPLLPTENTKAFSEYYTANVAALTAAEGKLDVLNTAITKYNAVEDTHKAQFADEYANICKLLDGYFINGNTVTYSMTDADKTAYPEVYNYFKNTVMTTDGIEGATAKHVALDKFNSRRMKSVTLAFKYDNDCTQGLGFGFIPEDIVVPEGVTTTDNKDYFVTSYTRAKYPDTTDGIYFYSACNYLKWDNANASKTLITKNSSALGNNFWTYNDTVLKNYDNLEVAYGSTYRIKGGDRIVFKLTFNTDLTEANGYSAVRVTPASYLCFIDADGDNDYTEGVDIKVSSFTQLPSEGVIYKYANDEAPLPYVKLMNDASIDNLLYFSTESEESFKDKYAEVLNGTDASADDVLAMYAAYNELSDSDKVIENVEDAVENAVTEAGLRPETNGATLRADGTMNMGFYGKAPSAMVTNGYISRFGILLAGYQNMVDAINAGTGDGKLTLNTAGCKVNSVSYSKDGAVADNILLALNGINVESTDTWKTKVVARVFVEYTVDGITVPVYSINADNGVAKPSNTDGIDQNGVCIRNVNSLLKALAADLYKNKDAKGDTAGLAVNGDTKYEGKKLSDNSEMLNNINTNISGLDRAEVFKFLCAYRKAF